MHASALTLTYKACFNSASCLSHSKTLQCVIFQRRAVPSLTLKERKVPKFKILHWGAPMWLRKVIACLGQKQMMGHGPLSPLKQ